MFCCPASSDGTHVENRALKSKISIGVDVSVKYSSVYENKTNFFKILISESNEKVISSVDPDSGYGKVGPGHNRKPNRMTSNV